jgi:hypothetical protein
MVALPSPRCAAAVLAVAAHVGCGDDGGGRPPSCLPDCPATRTYDAVAYDLRARFDAEARALVASEDITLADVAGAIVELDAEVAVDDVHAGGQRLAFAYDADAHALHVDVGLLLADGGPLTFTVEYRAPLSNALVYAGARDDDPVTSRVLYTDSEPLRGRKWLVGKHEPADRATFSVELAVAAGDDAIGNGARVRDDTTGGERTIGYRLDRPVPTYLMAFAAGELTHVDAMAGTVPIAVWHRRGLLVDPSVTLAMVARQMAFFSERIGPYPWDSYAVVLLPQFSGGMENVTITFNSELTSQGVVSFSLNAHELAHQWFGDHVTVTGWDDLWTKEGMATFLAAEAELPARDDEGRGRMFGADFLFLTSTAVVDPALPPASKYTDGPYGRAAWVITQLRRMAGDEAFWGGLRALLRDHALGSIDSETFVRAFAPALDEATIQRTLGSLTAHTGPELAITSTAAAGGALDVTLALTDPEQVLIAPIELTVVDAAGAGTAHAVDAAAPTTSVTVPAGGYAAGDERGVHPSWPRAFAAGGGDYGRLAARTAPAPVPGPALAAYLSRSAAHPERFIAGALAVPEPADYRAVYDDLDSVVARDALLTWTCAQFNNVVSPAALATVIEPLLKAPPITRYNSGFMRCPVDLATRALGAELAAAVAAPTAANAARLEHLISFDYGTATNFARLTALASGAPSLRLRERALTRMVAETSTGAPRRIPDADRPAWRAFFRGQYAIARTSTRFLLAWSGSLNLADLEALPIVAPMLHTVSLGEGAQFELVCSAYLMTQRAAAAEAWAQFRAGAMPWDTLAPRAAMALADPTACEVQRRRPAVVVDEDVAHGEKARLGA